MEVETRFKNQRVRSRRHLDWVKSLPCSVPRCPNRTIDPHHITFAQPRAKGLKVSDEFTVPLCRIHHDAAYPEGVHAVGQEADWWARHGIDPLRIAERLASVSRSAGRLP